MKISEKSVHTIETAGQEEITFPRSPTKEDFVFEGWFLDKDVWTSPFTATTLLNMTLTSDISVYAKWKTADAQHEHAYGEWTTVTAATCTATGSEKRTCTGCENEETRVIEKMAHKFEQKHDETGHWDECVCGEKQNITDHAYGAEWSSDETNHWRSCDVCNQEKDIAAHTYVDRVCTSCAALDYTRGLAYIDYLNGGLSVSGLGRATDTDIYIPSTYNGKAVTSIDNSAFDNCSHLTSINIPSSVTSIGSSAFRYCSSLTSVTIPDSVTIISNYAFSECRSLVSITIPNSVTSIGENAFLGCSSLVGINIPSSVTSIGWRAFDGCSSLKRVDVSDIAAWCKISFSSNPLTYSHNLYLNDALVTELVLPNSVTNIGNNVFSGCSNLVGITIPNSVTSIGDHAFYDCSSLTDITIRNSVTSIGNNAFYNCSSLTSITIPDSMTSIGGSAFDSCSRLTGINIPNGVTSIGGSAFDYCPSLTRVDISDIAAWCNILFANNTANPLYYAHNLYLNGELVTEVVIPDSVTSIGKHAFFESSSLVSVTIESASVASSMISLDSAGYLAKYAKTIYIKSDIKSVGSYITDCYYIVTTDKDGYVKYVEK